MSLWYGFRQPRRSDWAIWIAALLTFAICVAGSYRLPFSHPITWINVVIGTGAVWFIVSSVVGAIVGFGRGFLAGLRSRGTD